jgi:PEP-CTERM motif
MRNSFRFKAAVFGGSTCLLFLTSASHAATANGLVVEPRVFNDFPTSTDTANINGGGAVPTPVPTPAGNIPVASIPASVTLNDTNLVNVGGGGFANRDDVIVSTNHGVTAYTGDINTGFTISANVTLNSGTSGPGTPRKEAGIRVNSGVSGDALFILDSDQGEIVAFGAGAPFFSFRPAIEPAYTPGQTIFMKEIYTPGPGGTTGANPGTMEYIAQLLPGGPLIDSGPLLYSNLEGGPTNYQIGFYDQVQPVVGNPTDFITASFNNINAVVPEPASLSMLAIGGIALVGRRRSKRSV